MTSEVHRITDALGADAISRRLGVKPRSVRHARDVRKFPARWFREIQAMCTDAGIACPPCAFNFIKSEEVAE